MSQDQEPLESEAISFTAESEIEDMVSNRTKDSTEYRGEVFSKRVPAGKRTYFFDIKTTRSGEDFFLTITESKRIAESRYEKHKIFLYKEDFGKFVTAMHEVLTYVREECLPEYEFRGLPDLSVSPNDPADEQK